jgi:hypothetical protein
VTSQKVQIQSLIQEIDEVLSKTTPRLPWVMSSDAMQQRQVLEETRQYLASLQQQMGTAENGTMPGASIAVVAPGDVASGLGANPLVANPMEESAQQVLQAVVQEMNYLRSNMLQPMRSDVDLLRQQRDALIQEIRQLEAQRQQYALPGQQNQQLLMEFLQSAFRQMQENLSMQVTQMVANLAAAPANPSLMGTAPSPMLNSADPAGLYAGRPEVQTQSDQLLLKLDSTLQVIFESLQNNVQTYQDSLEQGLSRMHNLGQQGETMFSALVTRLAEQLGREASSYLQSSSEWQTDRPSLPEQEAAFGDTDGDTDIARLLDELNTIDPAKPDNTIQPAPVDLQGQASDAVNADLNNLDLLDLELKQIDLNAIEPEPFALPDDEMTLFQDDQAFSSLLNESITRIQDESEDGTIVQSVPPEETNLDSALDLLNQLSAEIQTEPLDHSEPEILAEETQAPPPLVTSPDNLYQDEFYQSLFGNPDVEPIIPNAIPDDSLDSDITAVEIPNATADSVDLTESWFSNVDDLIMNADAGLTEPSLVEAEIPIADAPPVLQAVEDLLLNPPHLQLSIAHDANLDQPDPIPPESPEDTVSSLLELIPDSEDIAIMPGGDLFGEEIFESAQPEEDLLSGMAASESLTELRLPADALQQLAADLSMLEEAGQFAGNEPDLAVTEDEDWTLPQAAQTHSDHTQSDEMLLTSFFDETIDLPQEPTPAIEDLFWESADPTHFSEDEPVEFIDVIELKEPEGQLIQESHSTVEPGSDQGMEMEQFGQSESLQPDEQLIEELFESLAPADAAPTPTPSIADLFASIAPEPIVTPESSLNDAPPDINEDLFGVFPDAPRPAAQPEGWDIFTEMPVSESAPAPKTQGTVDELFSGFQVSEPQPSQPTPANPVDDQSSTNTSSHFTLERMDDLFSNLPPLVQPDQFSDTNDIDSEPDSEKKKT